MQAQVSQKTETQAAVAPWQQLPANDPFKLSSRVASPQVGAALIALSATVGPIDPTIRLLGQAEVAYSQD